MRVAGIRAKARLRHAEDLIFVCRRRTAIVEFVDMNARTCRASVYHKCVLHEASIGFVWLGAVDGFEWVWVLFKGMRRGNRTFYGRWYVIVDLF